jgi:osmotically-inducible protein OsmY
MSRVPLITLVAAGLLASTSMLANAENLGPKLSDQQITEQVKQSLAMNDPAIAPSILVSTHDGVVTLQGRTMTKGNILAALHDAENVSGVVRVDNQLKLG